MPLGFFFGDLDFEDLANLWTQAGAPFPCPQAVRIYSGSKCISPEVHRLARALVLRVSSLRGKGL